MSSISDQVTNTLEHIAPKDLHVETPEKDILQLTHFFDEIDRMGDSSLPHADMRKSRAQAESEMIAIKKMAEEMSLELSQDITNNDKLKTVMHKFFETRGYLLKGKIKKYYYFGASDEANFIRQIDSSTRHNYYLKVRSNKKK